MHSVLKPHYHHHLAGNGPLLLHHALSLLQLQGHCLNLGLCNKLGRPLGLGLLLGGGSLGPEGRMGRVGYGVKKNSLSITEKE